MSPITVPLSCWRQGRTVTVTFSVSLVVLLRVIEPTVPTLVVCSSTAGVTDRPPAACAVAAVPSMPAQATTTGAARRRVLTDTIRDPPRLLTPGQTNQPAAL